MNVCVVSASGQNVFFAELLDALSDALRGAGLMVERSVDRFPPWRDDQVYLFVPHEYLPLVQEPAHPSPAHLQRSVALCTEQPGTSWFESAIEVAARAGAVIDINPLGIQALRRRGISARLLQLGYVPAWDRWGGNESGERPVDVTFMGGYTPRRGRALAMCARALADRRVDLRVFETVRPHLEDSAAFLSRDRKWDALRRAKVIVNIHRSELAYLEWQRIVGAMLNGCVVLTEHSLGFSPLVPGEHFVSVGYARIPLAINALLAEPERLAEIRHSAYRLLREELPMERTIAPLVAAVEEVAERPVALPVPAPVRPLPRPPASQPTECEKIFGQRSEIDAIKAALKDLVLGQRALQRAIARTVAAAGEERVHITRHGPAAHGIRVSVILTVHNYADLVGRAIASVAASDFPSYELIVVDDGSTDRSLESVRTALERFSWMTSTVIACQMNGGLAAARNRGIEQAAGELVFILDADNLVYPHALGRLVSALDDDPGASFAYSIIEQFDVHGPCDVIGWQDWDPDRLRYGNYIDAMALIRRKAIIEVGGYTSDRNMHGWEDFDLWCAFADHGWRGVRVPEILCRYRKGAYSMISTTNIDGQAAWGSLTERYGFLTRAESQREAMTSLRGVPS